MSSFLRQSLGVSDSGVLWDAGNFKLYQSTDPSVVLFITKRPELVKNDNGRYEIAVSVHRQQQPDGSIKIVGGTAAFSITSALQWNPDQFRQAQDSWRAAMGGSGPADPRFVPLNTRTSTSQLLINDTTGKPHPANIEPRESTPGGTQTFLVELTELGAQEWMQAIKNKTSLPGGVKIQYEYLRMMPTVGAEVKVWGRRAFSHFSAALNVSYNGIFYGGSAQIEAAWENMVRNGDVEITFIGGGLPPELEAMRQELTKTFADQARQYLFDFMFAPKPNVEPAQAGSSGGIFGGANFAMKWRSENDSIDLSQTIKFEGMTWLKGDMDVSFMGLFSELDPSYVTEVQVQQAFPVLVQVNGDPLLSNTAVSMSYSEGRSPDAPTFGAEGGNQNFVVFSQNPPQVEVNYLAKMTYDVPRWPVISYARRGRISDGFNANVINPGEYISRNQFYMLLRDGDRILPPREISQDDYVVLNVSYRGPHIQGLLRDSVELNGLGYVEFAYPLDPNGGAGDARYSAVGVVGGKLVRSNEVKINPNETAIFIAVDVRTGKLQAISSNSQINETDRLAARLLQGRARATSETTVGGRGAPASESGRRPASESGSQPGGSGEIMGKTVAVEYGGQYPLLHVRDLQGKLMTAALRNRDDANVLDDTSKYVHLYLDSSGKFIERFWVELSPN